MSKTIPRSDDRLTALLALTTLLTLTTLLAACGGGSSAEASAPPVQESVEYVPAAASEGVSVFAGWLKQMSTESTDGKDSMDTSTFSPTMQEDVEPVAAPL